MKLDRRQFLTTSAAGAALASAPAGPGWAADPPVRLSIDKFMQSPKRVDQLRTLFAEMRKKKASDPASYFFQGATHWFPNLGAASVAQRPDLKVLADMFNGDPKAKDMLGYWNQCTHNGVKTPADFLLWHRAYLYYFERHARATLGDASFAVPYWDYRKDAAASRRLPAIFLGDKLPAGGPNPLYPLGGLARSLNSATAALDEFDVDTDQCMGSNYYFTDSGLEGFGDSAGSAGSIDFGPHGTVHGGIGGWMGSVLTAGFDPVFWVHHANIDRLFNRWLAKKRYWSRSMAPQELTTWLGNTYTFFDAGGKLVSRPRSFFLDQKNLGYSYDSDPAMIIPLTLPPAAPMFAQAPGPNKALANVGSEVKGFFEKSAGSVAQPVQVSAAKGLALSVPLTVAPAAPGAPASGMVPLAMKSQDSGKHNFTVLELRDVKKAGELGGNYGVFVGPLANEAKDASSPAFVGRFSSFEAPEQGFTGKGVNYRFDITRQLSNAAVKNLESLTVRIVPMPSSKTIADVDRPGALVINQVEVKSLIGSMNPVK